MNDVLQLPIVDAESLPDEYRQLLRPAASSAAAGGRSVGRPRYFYEIDSWETAMRTELSPHFALWEFVDVDVREPPLMRSFPRYVPCAVSVLVVHLELFRREVGVPVRIAANGGYRSPSHEGADPASPHTWGTAANIYRIGDVEMSDRGAVERYADIARRVLPAAWCRPFGSERGQTTDHLHIDVGFIVCVPGAGR
ncbi:MAG: hypothetical protein LC753_03550 [Acidobacteria bacterium]|nr:hypothetical protein [Acidobacteriota bacterium]MCA1649374.1 hypothetical protein [Acidobacteriota bacterium]